MNNYELKELMVTGYIDDPANESINIKLLEENTGEYLTFSNSPYKNDGGIVQIASISFDMTFNGPIDSSEVWVEARDAAGNHFDIQLPMTLTVL